MPNRCIAVWTEHNPDPCSEYAVFYYYGAFCPNEGDFLHNVSVGNAVSGMITTNSNLPFLQRSTLNQLRKDYPLAVVIDHNDLR